MKTNEGKKRFVVLKFLLIVLGAALVGFCLGFGVMWLRETVLAGQAGALADAAEMAARALPWVSWVISLALTLGALALYLDCRAKFLAWDGEDEDLIEGVEHRLGVNQQQMGALVGTSRQTISQIERGDYSPSVTLALKIARVCQVRVEDIFWYEEEESHEDQ